MIIDTTFKILPLSLNSKINTLSQQQQSQSKPTPEQVYQLFNKSELDSRQMFEIIYNAYLKSNQELANEKARNAQLIERLTQFTKQTQDVTDQSKIIKKPKGKK